jgi:hypothetical protein
MSYPGWGELVPVRGELEGKRVERVNMVQIVCTHICKCKNDTC